VTLHIGDQLPEIVTPPVDRLRIAYMTVAMRDPNLVHMEDAYAAKSGLPSVIAHGTFVTSYAGAVVTRAVGADALRRIRVDVTAPVFPGDVLRATGVVTGSSPGPTGAELTIELSVVKQDGTQVGRGTAVIAQDPA